MLQLSKLQTVLKRYMLNSRTATWSNMDTFKEFYYNFYGRYPSNTTLLNRRYKHVITWKY